MATDNLSGINEAIRKAAEAYAEALASVNQALQKLASQAGGGDRDRMVENWLRVARMSKDGIVNAMERGYEFWEREMRRTAAPGARADAPSAANPFEAWAENWKRAAESFTAGGVGAFGEEARKQAENIQKTVQEGLKAWQRLWEPTQKS